MRDLSQNEGPLPEWRDGMCLSYQRWGVGQGAVAPPACSRLNPGGDGAVLPETPSPAIAPANTLPPTQSEIAGESTPFPHEPGRLPLSRDSLAEQLIACDPVLEPQGVARLHAAVSSRSRAPPRTAASVAAAGGGGGGGAAAAPTSSGSRSWRLTRQDSTARRQRHAIDCATTILRLHESLDVGVTVGDESPYPWIWGFLSVLDYF